MSANPLESPLTDIHFPIRWHIPPTRNNFCFDVFCQEFVSTRVCRRSRPRQHATNPTDGQSLPQFVFMVFAQTSFQYFRLLRLGNLWQSLPLRSSPPLLFNHGEAHGKSPSQRFATASSHERLGVAHGGRAVVAGNPAEDHECVG